MKTTLKWRLGKLPTTEEVLKLVNDKLITKEEAREILFSEEENKPEKVEDLKQEIKFLRKLIEQLGDRSRIVETIRYIEKPYTQWGWYQPYVVYCASGGSGSITVTSGSSSVTNAVNAVSSSLIEANNFSDIQTF